MKIGLVGPSYQERSLPFDAQDTINLYPVLDQSGKEVSALYGTPGLKLFSSGGTGANRGHFNAANGRAFAVIGAALYEQLADGTRNLLGTINQSNGIVYMDENGFQLAICDGYNVYIYTYATNTFALVNDPDLPPASSLCFIDGYFVISVVNSGKFYISALYDGTQWGPLDFATAESSPDNLLRVHNAVGQLWLFGPKTTEIYTNTGASAFPFERISGAKMETGILAPASTASVDNSVFWVGQDNIGKGVVYRAKGFTPQRISTNPIEEIIQRATDPTNIRAFTYQQDGHVFYIITGGGLPVSLVYDISTQQWHKRAYLNKFGQYEQHLGVVGMYAFGLNLVGDRNNGNIYIFSQETYTDNGDPLCRERIYTHLGDESRIIRYNSLEIGFEVGVGTQTGQGFDPQCLMQLSNDGAKTWSNWFSKPIGKTGEYRRNVIYRRLGIAEQMTFRIRITDPVKVAICGSYLK